MSIDKEFFSKSFYNNNNIITYSINQAFVMMRTITELRPSQGLPTLNCFVHLIFQLSSWFIFINIVILTIAIRALQVNQYIWLFLIESID